ncbi:MAG TPA: peptidase M3 [Caldithrix sp.]|nr:peptidase M3 [Caldithrix sp.]
MTNELRQFIQDFEKKVVPLSRELNLAYFKATTTGKKEYYQQWETDELKMSKILSDKSDFAKLKKFKESGLISDPILQRELTVLYNKYLEKQIDPQKLEEMIRRQTAIEKKYSTFRAKLNGKELTDNDIELILKTETNSEKLKNAWLASKQIGAVVADSVLQLVKMRNEAARELGFANYHAMKLNLSEQDPEQIGKLFDELDSLTANAFAGLKDEIDNYLARKYRIKKSELMPWHYQNRFFQEAPKIYQVDLDEFYKDKDLVEIVRNYYAGIGLPIDEVIEQSDLFERKGKYQHAYSTDIDREGDVRVVCNVKPNYNWMNTLLHEFGHSVYDKYSDRNLPWVLREPAHTFTTEAIAMMFGRFAANPDWLTGVAGVPRNTVEKVADACRKSQRLDQLVFSRWAQVMYRFEKSMYQNPDQDLNTLWWQLVEKYQLLKKPAGRNQADWAAKIHVALYPAYYHNYLMGELLASQLYYYITNNVLQGDSPAVRSFANQKAVGRYLAEKIFMPGKRYYWDDMIEKATGEKLTAKYYAQQFVD